MRGPTHEALFNKFRDDIVINRCEQYAKWSIPYLMADITQVGRSGRVLVERDFQEIGALLVNNLAAKLASILFPTQYPFFQASASPEFEAAAREHGFTADSLKAAFAQMEMEANKRLFINSGYAQLILALKHLIVTGNVLIYRDAASGKLTTYGLQSFSVRRDGTGEMLDCVLREYTTVEALPETLQAALRAQQPSRYSRPEQVVTKYTRIHRGIRKGVVGYEVSQEVDSLPVGDVSWYPKNLSPWMCPTWVLIPGEHYGRGMVEDYAGGFAQLSSLSEASALYAIEIMRVVNLVGSGSGGDLDDLANSETGEWIRGNPNDISAHEAGDAPKLAQVEARIDTAVVRLSKAFMYQGATRQAERVTAYELHRDAQEAELTLGGVYSTLSGGVQVPLAYLLMIEVSADAMIGLITGELVPDVTAGIPALGRAADVQNLLLAAQEIAAVLPIVQLDPRIDPARVTDVILAGRSIDTKTLFFTPEQQKANTEARNAERAAAVALQQAQGASQAGEQLAQIA